MYLNDMALRQKPRFFDEASEVFDKPGCSVFFDSPTFVANGQYRRSMRVTALASDVGFKGLNPINKPCLG